mgnify:CR=1 FL=1
MKTLTILLLGVTLIFAGCSKTDEFPEENMSDLQLKSADSKTVNFVMHDADPTWAYWSPLICDGDTVDILLEDIPGEEITVHVTAHLIDGKIVWAIFHCKGSLTSEKTGETYKIVDQTRLTFDENFELTSNFYHVHAKGDKGSRIINFFELDYDAQTYVLTKSVCSGNDE